MGFQSAHYNRGLNLCWSNGNSDQVLRTICHVINGATEQIELSCGARSGDPLTHTLYDSRARGWPAPAGHAERCDAPPARQRPRLHRDWLGRPRCACRIQDRSQCLHHASRNRNADTGLDGARRHAAVAGPNLVLQRHIVIGQRARTRPQSVGVDAYLPQPPAGFLGVTPPGEVVTSLVVRESRRALLVLLQSTRSRQLLGLEPD